MSKQQSGRGLWWTFKVLSWLPLPVVTALGGALGVLLTRIPLRYASAWRVVLINILATHPKLSVADAERLGRNSVRELGRTFTEFAHVWCRPAAETLARISKIEGEQAFLAASASERPVLLLSLHQGSWESSNLYLGDKGETLVMYQPHPASYVDAKVKAAREQTGSTLIPTNAQGVKEALSGMRRGATLALLSDHNPGNRSNPFVPFFDYPVPTPALVDKLVQRFRPHVFVVNCLRGPGGANDIHLHFHPAPEIEQGDNSEQILLALNQALQRCVVQCPEQYQWTYKRFKRGPQGRREWYRQSHSLLARARAGESREALGLLPERADSGTDA